MGVTSRAPHSSSSGSYRPVPDPCGSRTGYEMQDVVIFHQAKMAFFHYNIMSLLLFSGFFFLLFLLRSCLFISEMIVRIHSVFSVLFLFWFFNNLHFIGKTKPWQFYWPIKLFWNVSGLWNVKVLEHCSKFYTFSKQESSSHVATLGSGK